jgi:hypothetical protein
LNEFVFHHRVYMNKVSVVLSAEVLEKIYKMLSLCIVPISDYLNKHDLNEISKTLLNSSLNVHYLTYNVCIRKCYMLSLNTNETNYRRFNKCQKLTEAHKITRALETGPAVITNHSDFCFWNERKQKTTFKDFYALGKQGM